MSTFHVFIRRVLTPHALINLRKAQALLRLRHSYSAELLEGAAQWTLANNLTEYRAFKQLVEKMKSKSTEQNRLPISQQTELFVRDANYFIKP